MSEKPRFVSGIAVLGAFVCALILATVGSRAQSITQEAGQSASPTPSPTASPSPSPSPTPTPVNWSTDPLLHRLIFRGIGPASMGGRIDDIAVVENDPYVFYVGFATGGLWKTTNNGTTFQP